MYGAGMAQDMSSDMLAGYGWLDFLCGLNMPRQQVCKALTGHCLSSGIEKKMEVLDGGMDAEPINQGGASFGPQWQNPLSSPLAHHPHSIQCGLFDAVGGQCDQFRHPQPSASAP